MKMMYNGFKPILRQGFYNGRFFDSAGVTTTVDSKLSYTPFCFIFV